jgi:hypothetical protein
MMAKAHGGRSGTPTRQYGAITLAFGFRDGHDFGQPGVSFRQAGCFFLTLRKKSFERLVQADGLIDLPTP